MKAIDLTVTLFAWDGLPQRQYASHTGRSSGGRSEMGLVTIYTDAGIEGHALLGSSVRGADFDAASLIRFLKPIVLEEDPLNRERIFKRMWARNRHTTARCIGAVDIALWDIAGKAAGLPIHALIGGFRNSVPAYASSAVLPSKEAYAEEALRVRGAGFLGYKLHPPTRPEQDIEVCSHVRDVVGADYRLMLDSSWSYTYLEAIRVGHAIEELDYYWFEDPLDADDITNYVKLRQKLGIPILATEYAPGGFQAMAPWITMQATDFLRGDVAVKGGITPLLRIAHLADAFHMNLEVHHGGNSLNNVANLHVIFSIPNAGMFEVILPEETQMYGLVEDIQVSPQDGHVRLPNPTRPGLGAEIDFELVRSKEIGLLR